MFGVLKKIFAFAGKREKLLVIMIAHRLKTVRHADQIIVLSGGHIVQHGTHEELIKEEGIYSNFIAMRQEAISWKLSNNERSQA